MLSRSIDVLQQQIRFTIVVLAEVSLKESPNQMNRVLGWFPLGRKLDNYQESS